MQGVFLQHPQKSRSHSDQVLTLAKEGDERARSSMLKVCKQNRSSHADFFSERTSRCNPICASAGAVGKEDLSVSCLRPGPE